jgi:hypothetical protein
MYSRRVIGTALLAAACLFGTVKAASLPHATESDHSGKTVHIVYSNHLDIGFDGIGKQLGTDDAVINKYFDEYFQRAVRVTYVSCDLMCSTSASNMHRDQRDRPIRAMQIDTAKEMRNSSSGDAYIWMTHVSKLHGAAVVALPWHLPTSRHAPCAV